MIVARHKRHIGVAAPLADYFLGEPEVLSGRLRLVLQDDVILGDPVFHEILCHGFRLGDILVMSLSARRDQDRRRGVLMIDLDCLVNAVCKELRDLFSPQEPCAVDNDVVKVPLARDHLQQQRVSHKCAEQR